MHILYNKLAPSYHCTCTGSTVTVNAPRAALLRQRAQWRQFESSLQSRSQRHLPVKPSQARLSPAGAPAVSLTGRLLACVPQLTPAGPGWQAVNFAMPRRRPVASHGRCQLRPGPARWPWHCSEWFKLEASKFRPQPRPPASRARVTQAGTSRRAGLSLSRVWLG